MKRLYTLLYIGTSLLLAMLSALAASCRGGTGEPASADVMVMADLCYPQATWHDGLYYFTAQGMGGQTVELYATPDLATMQQARHRVVVAQNDSLTHIWSPELHRIGGKWYVYFEADDGNTDNHHLYVMECTGSDPVEDGFVMKGAIDTHAEWNYGIHPSVLQLPGGELYLLWSGWPSRRNETETQCIYIARMADPCTLATERTMISSPIYEWERQWINPDGDRSAYPIYVNENPQPFISPDGRRVVVLYSASGIWTVYTSTGMLSAPVGSNLLDSASWTKCSEPVLCPDTVSGHCFANVCLVATPNGGSTVMLYERKWREQGILLRHIYMRPVEWTPDGTPLLTPQ